MKSSLGGRNLPVPGKSQISCCTCLCRLLSTSWGGTHQVIQPQMASAELVLPGPLYTNSKEETAFWSDVYHAKSVQIVSQMPVSLRD